MSYRTPRRRRRRCLLLAPLAALLSMPACMPFVGEENVVLAASAIMLQPELTCTELADSFGLPNVEPVTSPAELNLIFGEFFVPTSDGETLRAWYLPADVRRGTVLLSIGAVGDLSCYLLIGYVLQSGGYDVILYEYRGFGQSTGVRDLEGLIPDFEAALDLSLILSGGEPVVAHAVSVGTIPAVEVAARRPQDIRGLILDAPIAIGAEIPRFWFLMNARPQDYIDDFDDEIRLELTIEEVTQPIFAVTYGEDEFRTSGIFEALVADKPLDVELLHFADLGHARGPYLSTATYFFEVFNFLDARFPTDAEVAAAQAIEALRVGTSDASE